MFMSILLEKELIAIFLQVISCVTISYMCVCVYYTVFKMRFFNYYYFAPKHQTDPNSLLFSGL